MQLKKKYVTASPKFKQRVGRGQTINFIKVVQLAQVLSNRLPVSVSWLRRPSFNSELSDFCCCYYRNVVWSESDVGYFNCRKVSNKTPIPVKSRKKYTRPGKSMSALLFVKRCMAFRNNLILLFYYQ